MNFIINVTLMTMKHYKKDIMKKIKKKTTIIIALVIVAIILISLGIVASQIQQPTVQVLSIKLKGYNPDLASITFLVTIQVYNPNGISATLRFIDANVVVNYDFTGKVFQRFDDEIKANDNTTIDVNFELMEIPIITSTTLEVWVFGVVEVSVFFLTFAIPIDETETIDLTAQDNTPPEATINHDGGRIVRRGQEIHFDGTQSTDPDGQIVRYEWTFGDGSPPASGPTVSHTYGSPGRYRVVLIVTDDKFGTDQDTVMIGVI